MKRQTKLAVSCAVLASAIAIGYGLGKARASGGPTMAPLWYSGQLTDANGNALPDGSHTFAIKLYRAGTTTALCDTTASPAGVMTSRGYFRVQLDACVATTVHAEPDTTLEVFIDGNSMGAAQKVGASPYALEATNAANAVTAATASAAGGALRTELDGIEAKLPVTTYAVDQTGSFGHAGPPLRFVGTPTTVTTTATQRITANLTVSFYSNGALSSDTVFGVPCYRQAGTSVAPTTFGPVASLGVTMAPSSASSVMQTSAGSVAPGAGSWEVGACSMTGSGATQIAIDVTAVGGVIQITN
jgi:hypothetical protein